MVRDWFPAASVPGKAFGLAAKSSRLCAGEAFALPAPAGHLFPQEEGRSQENFTGKQKMALLAWAAGCAAQFAVQFFRGLLLLEIST